MVRMTQQELENRYKTYLRLGSMIETAKHFGVTRQAISTLFKYYGFKIIRKKGRLNTYHPAQDKIKDAVLKISDRPTAEIARTLNACYATVRTILRKENIKRHVGKTPKLSNEQEASLCYMYKDYSSLQLSKVFGISQPAILYYLNKNNIKKRKRGWQKGFHRKGKRGGKQ